MYTRDLLQNVPSHQRALSNLAYFEKVQTDTPELYVDAEPQNVGPGDSEFEKYEALCREDKPIVSDVIVM